MELNDLVENLRPECKICYEKYSDDVMPKMLHCSHSFCKECIQKLIDSATKKHSTILRCPCCRKRNKFQPNKGVDSFKNNLDLRNVSEMVTMLPGRARTLSESSSIDHTLSLHTDEAEDATATEEDGPCKKHGATLNRYCVHCARTICNECILAEHYEHMEDVTGLAEYAQQVKTEMLELLELARDLPFMRIKVAADRTRKLVFTKETDLMIEIDHVVESAKNDIEGDLSALEDAKQVLLQLGNKALDKDKEESHLTVGQAHGPSKSLADIDEVLQKIEVKIQERESASPLGLTFVGMKPDGSVGDFIRGKLNIVGHIVDKENVFYVADNRKHDYVVLIGVAHVGASKVSKWIMSFKTEDRASPVVFSSQVLEVGQQRCLLIAVGRTVYKVNVALGKCIAEKIQQIHVKEGVITMEDSSSINGVDWFHDDHRQLAILSLNTGKSIYLIDTVTKSLLRSMSTPINPSVLSCRQSDKGNSTIARDNSKLVILGNNGSIESRIGPSKALADFIPWVSCWVHACKPSTIAVVWCKSHVWKIAIHDAKGKVVKELQENTDSAIPVSIAYNEVDGTFLVSSNEGTNYYPKT